MAFDAGAIEATLTLDRTPFQRGLDQARSEKQRFADDDFSVSLDIDTAAALGHLDEFRASQAGDSIGIGIDVGTAKAGVALADWRRLQEATALNIGIDLDTIRAGIALGDWRRLQEAAALGVGVNVDTTLATARMAEWRATEGSHTVKADVEADTSGATRSIDSFGSRWNLIAAAIVASTPFIGGAILAGVGAGFVGVAALAEKSNAQVKSSWSQLWQDVVAETRAASDQIVPQIVGAANQIDTNLRRLGPDLQQAMAAAGPDINILTRGIDNLAQNAVPGLTSAMRNSQPVAQGMASLLGILGTAAGTTFDSLGQHSGELGTDLDSLGRIVQSVLGLATTLIEVAGAAWAQNAGTIDAAINGVTTTASSLAQGALPLLSGMLGTVAEIIKGITTVLGPIAPLLGTIGGVALVTFGAFKLAQAVTSGVNSLATSVLDLGVKMESASVAAAAEAATLEGVEVTASTSAAALTAAGTAAGEAALGFSAAAASLATPIGIAVAVTAAVIALGSAWSSSSSDGKQMSTTLDDVTAALQRNHGAVNQSVIDALKMDPAFKKGADAMSQAGVSADELANAIVNGGPAYDAIVAKIKAHNQGLDDGALRTATQVGILNDLTHAFGGATQAAAASNAQQQSAATTLSESSQYQAAASGTAQLLGLSLGDVTAGYRSVIASAGAASSTVAGTSEAFIKNALAVAQAATAMQTQLTQADQQVVQAQQQVADASHGVEQAVRGVTDAQHAYEQAQRAVADANQGVIAATHSLEQAQRSLQDAYTGVASAEQAYARSQESEREAEAALHTARQQAIQDLKDLHLQLEDQVVSEAQARVRLFDAEQAGAALGVTGDNARAISMQQVTATNEAQVKAALDLISAQNAVNDSLNTGEKLRAQVNAADQAGVEGSSVVVSAQKALQSAQDQVTSSAQALQRAHQQVSDAEYGVQQAELGLQRAHQQVTDAAWALQKAGLAVTDAHYQEQRAADQLRVAEQNLTAAQDAASRSLDLHTAAGQRNVGMVLTLWDAITKQGLPLQEQYRTAIDDVAAAFGGSRDQAADYLKQLGLIPKDFQYSVTAITQVDRANFDSWLKGVLSTGGYAMDSRNQQKYVGGTGYASGGQFRGVGGPREDANLAWISDGEYIVNAAATAQNLPILDAINSGVMGGDGAALPGYASGGLIEQAATSVYTGASLGAAWLATNNARRVMHFPTMPDLPRYDPATAGMIAYNAGGGVAQWAPLILQALAALGQSAGWLGTVERRMMQESGGNPNAINLTDINAQRGDPSRGLMQTIGATFAAYRNPAWSSNIYDPLANIYAGLNYAIHRYGTLDALNQPGGYDNGGLLDPGWTAVFNGTRTPENVRTAQQEDQLLAEIQALRAEVRGDVHIHQSFSGHNWSAEELAAASSRRAAEAFRGLG